MNIVNANLANDVGNCLNRTLTLLKKNCGSRVPMDSGDISEDHPVRLECERRIPEVPAAYEGLDFAKAAESILAVSGRGNQYLEEAAPWLSSSQKKRGQEEGGGDPGRHTGGPEGGRDCAAPDHAGAVGQDPRAARPAGRGAAGGGVGGNGVGGLCEGQEISQSQLSPGSSWRRPRRLLEIFRTKPQPLILVKEEKNCSRK